MLTAEKEQSAPLTTQKFNIPPLPNFKVEISKKEEVLKNNEKIITREWMPEEDKLFQFSPTPDQIQTSNTVIEGIIDLVSEEFHKKQKGILDIVALYLTTDWVWKTNTGSLTKRLSKWYHTHYKDDMSEDTLTKIGNIFHKEIPKSQRYIFDITKTFNWNAGDFADSGSCFWGSNARARTKMQCTDGYYAIRFFKPSEVPHPRLKVPDTIDKGTHPSSSRFQEERFLKSLRDMNRHYPVKSMENERFEYFNTYTGYARAWLYTSKWSTKVNNITIELPIIIIFNGYGIQTNLIASIFAEAMQLPVRRLTIKNEGVASGYLYVNDVGYVIGDPKVTDQVNVFDFKLKFA